MFIFTGKKIKAMDKIEGNRLICEFMEFDYYEPNDYLVDINMVEAEIYNIQHMMFSSSWDWLMPVVKSVNLKGYAGGILYALYDALKGVDIEAAFNEVVRFIKWYNKNKKR